MKLINWTPRTVSLFDDMDKMVKTVFNNSQYSPRINENWVPAVDIKEDNISFVLSADIPGLSKSDIDLLVDNNVLLFSLIMSMVSSLSIPIIYYVMREIGTRLGDIFIEFLERHRF